MWSWMEDTWLFFIKDWVCKHREQGTGNKKYKTIYVAFVVLWIFMLEWKICFFNSQIFINFFFISFFNIISMYKNSICDKHNLCSRNILLFLYVCYIFMCQFFVIFSLFFYVLCCDNFPRYEIWYFMLFNWMM